MEKPTLTIEHKEGNLLSVLFFLAAGFIFFLNTALSPSRQEEQLLGYAIAVTAGVLGVFFLLWARCSETLDADGITIRRPFGTKHHSWEEVGKIGIQPPQGKDLPKLWLQRADGRHIAQFYYTKRSLACIRFYYGDPDYDNWNNPPTTF